MACIKQLPRFLLKGEDLSPNAKMYKMVEVCEKISATQTYHRGGPAAGGYGDLSGEFFVFFWKKRYFNAVELHFARVQSHLKDLDF